MILTPHLHSTHVILEGRAVYLQVEIAITSPKLWLEFSVQRVRHPPEWSASSNWPSWLGPRHPLSVGTRVLHDTACGVGQQTVYLARRHVQSDERIRNVGRDPK